MKSLIKILFQLSGNLISKIINNNDLCLKAYNYLYERLPYILVCYCVKYISLPNKNFHWTIRLLNNRLIKTPIHEDNIKTVQFALSYQWHSPAINLTEYLLNQFYEKDAPWIDVGSNLGLRSLLALSENREVYFIEPNNEVNSLNIERCKLNNFNNYTLYPAGASNSTGKQQFAVDNTSYCSSIETNLLDSKSIHHVETIYTDTIDNMFRNILNLSSGLCIKIDVEGHELRVIEGAKNTIHAHLPTLIIEINDKENNLQSLSSYFWSLGYAIYEIGNFRKNKYFKKIDSSHLLNSDNIRYNDFLIVHNNTIRNLVKQYEVNQ